MSAPESTSSSPPNKSSDGSRLKEIGVKVGLVLGVAVLAFLVGWLVGGSPVGDLRDRTEAAESRLALTEDHLHMSQALALLYRTALDLEARNFGTANDRIDETAAVLEKVGVAGSSLDSLMQQVSATDLSVAEDLAAQRAGVLDLAARLEALLEDPQPDPGAAGGLQ